MTLWPVLGRPAAWTSRLVMTEAQRFLLLSILIGVFAGLLVVCFHIAIDFIRWYAVGTLAQQTRHATLLSPALGATASAFLVLVLFRQARGSGVNQTKAAVYISDGHVPFSTVIGKFLACSIAIGSGNSLGPEDPSLQMGSGVASLLGRAFRLARSSMRMIAPVGAAAGIAAAFNAPITGVLFVMEEVLAGWHTGVLGSIVLSATSAVVVSRWFLGNQPLFSTPEFELRDPLELIVHALIGVAGGLLAVAFMKTIAVLRRRLRALPRWTRYVQPGVAGLLVGVAGLWLPDVMGAGYEGIDRALHNAFGWKMLLALGLVKIAVTLLCFSAGTPGGMFAPTLFAGAMIGGALGSLAQTVALFPTSSTDAYVLVGMGTFFAGVFRAPMTSVFMVFEVSANYVIILPVLIANTIAYALARSMQRTPFFEMHAREEGLDLPSVEEQREGAGMRVEDAMGAPVAAFGPRTPVNAALDLMRQHGDDIRLVKLGYGEWGWVRRSDLETAAEENGRLALEDALGGEPAPSVYPDMPLDSALRLIGAHPALPVSSRANKDQLMGILRLEDIHHAYGIGERGKAPPGSA
ncbi:MAG: chloride channel protein [Bryobacteraceae bacterium]|nr:chloride channel protein [Bryobacteraceae bacterium]